MNLMVRLPPVALLRQVARINLTCGPIDMGIIRETMHAVLGEVPEGGVTHAHASALTLYDLRSRSGRERP
jgi:hypothetical protein